MTIREASSIIVRRDRSVFLVQRASRLRFFGGFWAFPGGTVPPAHTGGPGDERGDDQRFARTAIRELFEELGLEIWSPALGSERRPLRQTLLELEGSPDRATRKQALEVWDEFERKVTFSEARMNPVCRLLTPSYHPVRYDTQFFRLDLDSSDGDPEVLPGELEEGRWDEPEVWLERWRRGELRIAPPVVLILHTLTSSGVEGEFGWEALASLTTTLGEGRIHTIFYNPAAQLLPLRTETLPPATHTNAYLVGSDPAYLIDPGCSDPDEQTRLVDALTHALEAGPVPKRRLGGILVTHHHGDHVGAVDRIRDRFGVPVWAHEATADRLEGRVEIDRRIADGERLALGPSPDGRTGWELEAIHTPGHAPGHLCFFERRYGSLFVGDMVSQLSSVLVRRKDGTMEDYLASLRRLAELPSEIVYPAHGPAVAGGPEILETQLRHRAEREAAILAVVASCGETQGRSAEEIVRLVYRDVPPEALPYAAESVASVADKLEREGRIFRVESATSGPRQTEAKAAESRPGPLETALRWSPSQKTRRAATLAAPDRGKKGASMKPKQRIAALREQLDRHGLDAYLVPSTDPHQSEYVPECWQRRQWISGFTGSAGEVVVTKKHAGLWTDGRYFLQAEDELRGSGMHLHRTGQPGVLSIEAMLGKTLPAGAKVGVDPQTLSIDRAASLETALGDYGLSLVFTPNNLVDAARGEDIQLPHGEAFALATKYSGESTSSKLRRLRKEMKEQRADAHVLSALDSVAWLFNIRGRDVTFNPVAIAYAIVTDKKATLYIDDAKVTPALRKALGSSVTLRAYGEFAPALAELGASGSVVWMDRKSASRWMLDLLGDAKRIEKTSPVVLMKAAKNGIEIEGMKRAHVRDGVAMVRFLRWVEEAAPDGGLTEISAADQLESFRAEGDLFQGLSFRTISGYAGHGAIIHYTVTPRTDVDIKAEGIYLLDSGGQYLDGTTDITRTILLGRRATKEQKERFTRVLKGHIAISRARFPKGTLAPALDVLARKALWDVDLDYNHGTGHGVGCFLNVHEGPRNIGTRPDGGYPLEAGNVLSNEPGYYKPGEYGIRIENLVLVVEDSVSKDNGKTYYRFEDLTVCPIDARLIDLKLLDPAEKKWVDTYHKHVKKTLSPFLEKEDREWLADACAPL
ncbi:MAG: aminopeptidase P family N-terminal domain-containing protein [Candidatus Eisenbacteria bacterium]|nr:aminopeptidase P family N-terminal domain-containing protein [Candidatus Eisenbacteria bacterium]